MHSRSIEWSDQRRPVTNDALSLICDGDMMAVLLMMGGIVGMAIVI
jgi:hypothetical protein